MCMMERVQNPTQMDTELWDKQFLVDVEVNFDSEA